MSKKRDNTKTSRKPKVKRDVNGKWLKGTPTPNPAGAPKRGQSWQEIYKHIGNLTPKEAAEYCHAVAGQLAKIGDKVTLKEAVVLRVYAALLFDPDARLLSVVSDREEGKVSQPVDINIANELRQRAEDAGIDIRSDPILLALFTALGVSVDNSAMD